MLNSRATSLSFFQLCCILLVEGFVTISLEMLTLRQLMPVIGNSVIVTSLVIGIFLLFLAYGYLQGGRYQKDYQLILRRNFAIAAVWLGIGLSYLFIEVFFGLFSHYFPNTLWIPLIFYLLLITAPLVYLLGQTVPIILSLWHTQQSIGASSGRVLQISTLGSFLGAVLTTLLLLNYIGVAWTVFVNFCLLMSLFLALLEKKWTSSIWILPVIGLSLWIYALNPLFEKRLFITTNNYANYQVINHFPLAPHHVGKLLMINGSWSSYLNEKKEAFAYIELIKKIIFSDLKLWRKHILVLGAGGFSLSAENTANNFFTYVDIDPAILSVVKKHYLSPLPGQFIADDARHYLNHTHQHYDMIVNDVYSHRTMVPTHLVTREYFQSIKNVLFDQGVAIFNIVGKPMLNDAYSKHIDSTIREVFKNCMVIPLKYTDAQTNIIYICKKTNSENDNYIYTDNVNRVTWEKI